MQHMHSGVFLFGIRVVSQNFDTIELAMLSISSKLVDILSHLGMLLK